MIHHPTIKPPHPFPFLKSSQSFSSTTRSIRETVYKTQRGAAMLIRPFCSALLTLQHLIVVAAPVMAGQNPGISNVRIQS